MNHRQRFEAALGACPVVAILRGLKPDEAVAIGDALYEAGIRIMEVPMNSPQPLESITRLAAHFGDRAVIGAGTVLEPSTVQDVAAAGGQIIVSPDMNPAVIGQALALDCEPLPGVFTATEAFGAIRAGAVTLKLFPGSTGGPGHIKALKAVLPSRVRVLAVGGVSAENYAEWTAAGASGAGCGSNLYKPGDMPDEVFAKATAMVAATR